MCNKNVEVIICLGWSYATICVFASRILNTLTGKVTDSLDDVILKVMRSSTMDKADIANKFASCFKESVRDILPSVTSHY